MYNNLLGICSTTQLLVKDRPILEQKPEYKLTPRLFLPKNSVRIAEGGLRTRGYFKKSYKGKLLISVVTVVFNGEKYLEQTIRSVLDQDYDNVEYIIIDGGSTDRTLSIIKKYEDAIDYWVSESDKGIYDAMNKGVSLCSGKYVAFLNADDWYNLDAVSSVICTLTRYPELDYLFGSVNMYDGETLSYIFKPRISQYRYHMPLPHPTLFVKPKILLKVGFDLKYKIIADYDFIIKIIKQDLKYKNIEKVITNFRVGGVSSILSSEKEHFNLAIAHFSLGVALKKYSIRNYQRYLVVPKKIIKKLLFVVGIENK